MTKKNDKNLTPEEDDNADEVKFEAALEELESLVAQMESGNLSLDESLKAFERGIILTRQCSSALKEAELKVQTLTQDGNLVDFDTDDLDGR
jgi:exodeoxyribonuclease VII small subunit